MASEYASTTSFLQSGAAKALTLASNNASRIYGLENVQANTRSPVFNGQIVKPLMGEPPKFSDLFGGESTDATLQYLDQQSSEWLSKYFPSLAGDFRDQPEETLSAILSNVRPFGLDKSILELVWHQARDRAARTKRGEQANLYASFSGRGFSLPPGALIDALSVVEQRASDIALDISREQAIKDADIKVEIFKLGLQLATQLKTGIMAALADFYRMWINVPDKDIERARIRAQAQSSLYGALSSYYNVELGFEELKLRAGQIGANIDLDVDRITVAKQGNYMGIAGPLASSVSAFAQISGNAYQAGGTLAAQVESI